MTAQSRYTLESEATVKLGNGTSLKASDKLGEGSFGAVWRMEGERGIVALKETISDSDESFRQALKEATMLQNVTLKSEDTDGIPKYLGHEGVRMSENQWRMRLLMTLVPGEPLDYWLHKRPVAADFHVALGETKELLDQMSKTMVIVEKHCVHRDISSHNIMVRDSPDFNSGRAKFSLIDFGLAVEAQSWSFKWRDYNLAGDCKYWPPSAWVLFTHGPAAVRSHSPEANQYIGGLDVFSLGVTCLEFLMLRAPRNCPVSCDLRKVWEDYWRLTSECWEQFYACFKGKSDWDNLRRHLTATNVTVVIMNKLIAVIQKIDRLAHHFAGDNSIYPVFNTLRFMLMPNANKVDFKTVRLHLQQTITAAPPQPSLFSHVRTASAYPGFHSSAPVQPQTASPGLGSYKLPVLADYRSPLFAFRRVSTSSSPFQN